ncbi:MAG: AAA family ATPase, partial [Dehalococcoidia bacterium]|nr:AAA family ATPase [Dehalococcoidia bacterium]
FFLYPLESERPGFNNNIRRKIAYEYIERDSSLNLSKEQKEEVRKELKTAEGDVRESIRKLYRIVAIPAKDGTKEIDLGIPTYGQIPPIDDEIFEKLRSEGEILSKIAPLVIREKFLSANNFALTQQIYQSALRTPGETRFTDRSVLEQGIIEGVRSGLFGLGELQKDKPLCHYYREIPTVAFAENEVILNEALCLEQRRKEGAVSVAPEPIGTSSTPQIKEEPLKWGGGATAVMPGIAGKGKVHLKFQVPKGKVSQIMGVMNLLQSKFGNVEIEIIATNGQISEQDYEDKIRETFRQLGVDVEER